MTSETRKLSLFQLRHRQDQWATRPAVSLRGGLKTGPGRRRKSSLPNIHLLVITGLICGMLTHQYLAAGDEQEASQINAGVKELHEEIFCDVVRAAFCLQLLKRLCQDSVLKSLLSVFPHAQKSYKVY